MKKLVTLTLTALAFLAFTGCDMDDFGHQKHLKFEEVKAGHTYNNTDNAPDGFQNPRDMHAINYKTDKLWFQIRDRSEPAIKHADNIQVEMYLTSEGKASAFDVPVINFRHVNVSDRNLLDDEEFNEFAIKLGHAARDITKDGEYTFIITLTNDSHKTASRTVKINIDHTKPLHF